MQGVHIPRNCSIPNHAAVLVWQERRPRSLLTALAASLLPTSLSLPIAFLLANVLMDKTSMMGVLPPPLGPAVPDVIIGAVIGLSVALSAGSLGPWLSALLPARQRKVRIPSSAGQSCVTV